MALACRHQQSIIPWITDTLKQLHLEKILDASQQDDIEQYWLLLARFEKHGQIEDLTQFSEEFNRLYSHQVVPSRLKIMTIHKSKGLEFDCVILPGLSTRPPGLDTPLLRWLKLPSHQQGELLLISPIKAAHQEECSLYNYLGQLDAQKSSYELQRLLYVATTRAKKRLYLFDNSDKLTQGTFRHLLQHHEFTITKEAQEVTLSETAPVLPSLYQLPLEFYHPQWLPNKTKNAQNQIPSIATNSYPRLIGIVAHELLQWVCDHHPATSTEIPWELANHQLKCLGFNEDMLRAAQHQLKLQLTQFFDDPIGQWLIKKHDHEYNEYELLVEEHDEIATKIIDRTFCENGVRWIVDFKTGLDDSMTESNHRQQVESYARLFVNSESSIKCGLYYLASNRWLAWEYINK